MVSSTLILILIFIILKIIRVIYAQKNLLKCAKKCEEIAEQYLKERWSIANTKRDKIIKSIFTPTLLKIKDSKNVEDFVENTSETIIDELPLFKISKGIWKYYKRDDYIEYLKDRYMLFSQPLIKVEYYKGNFFSYIIIFIAMWGLVITASEQNIDFSTATFYLMLIPVLSSIYKLMNLIGLKYSSKVLGDGILIENYKVKYVFTPIDENRITVEVDNKIMKQKFTYKSKYI